MASKANDQASPQRREFFRQAAAAAAAMAWTRTACAEDKKPEPDKKKPPAEAPMPTMALGKHRISRLIAGWNPIGGTSQPTLDMARAMREYFTVENTVDFLRSCEKNGISAWQFEHTQKAVESIQKLREGGSKLKLICLHAERSVDATIKTVVEETAPVAMVHHGNVTDSLFRSDKEGSVRDYLKKVHDAGLLAGVSSHCPDNVKRIADEGWECDFFMCSFYYVTRPVEEQQKMLGTVAVGEPFFESDPAEMSKVMRAVKQPCLAYKILAAGRLCSSKHSTEQAFKAAYSSIKPNDGVIVGMFPRYSDQVAEDSSLARKHGTA